MKITSVTIRNIKGISNKTFNLDLSPNKPTLLVAPNGFGKSSFAIGFNSMNNNRINLNEKHLHQGQTSNLPEIEIQYTDDTGLHTVQADSSSNTISNEFSSFVINSQLKAKAKQGFEGRRATASIDIDSIVLIDSIPSTCNFSYSHSQTSRNWGTSSTGLPNISTVLSNPAFISGIHKYYTLLGKQSQTRISNAITSFKDAYTALTGTGLERISAGEAILPSLTDIPALNDVATFIKDSIQEYHNKTVEPMLATLIIGEYFNRNKDLFKDSVKYSHYKNEKKEYEDLITSFSNGIWQNIRPKVQRGKVVVEFPKAHQISNGQRDILCFLAMLVKAKKKLTKANNILIIDEVFDYLDDANLVSAQYYVTKFIKEMKAEGKKIFPLILTHINPMYFHNYAFKKPAVKFLDAGIGYRPNNSFKKLLRKRNDRGDSLHQLIERYFLHFHTDTFDLEGEFQVSLLPQSWGRDSGTAFKLFMHQECQTYLANQPHYDPLVICCAVRCKIEEKLFQKLTEIETQTVFFEKHGTSKKLNYLDSLGISVSEKYYLLGIVYNDGLHWRDNQDNYTPIASKLENLVIKDLIRQVLS